MRRLERITSVSFAVPFVAGAMLGQLGLGGICLIILAFLVIVAFVRRV